MQKNLKPVYPPFRGDQIRLFYGNVSDFHTADCLTFLSEKETARAERFLLPDDKNRFIVARAILKQLLARSLHMNVTDIVLHDAQNGKPFLPGNPELCFSCAHTGDAFAIGMAHGREIGIDVENAARTANVNALQHYVLTPSELEQFHGLHPDRRQEAFIEAWIRKEALLKATGDGLTRPMSSLAIAFPENGPLPSEMAGWFIESYALPGNYRAAVAVNGPVSSVHRIPVGAHTFSSPKAS